MKKLKSLDKLVDPFERLKAIGYAFIDFAQKHRDYYNLMFIVEEQIEPGKGGFPIAQEAIAHLHDVLAACQEKGRFQHMDLEYLTFMVLSAVHGICALFCKDRTSSFVNKSNEDLMKNGYECFVALLEQYKSS
jgi:hypothetical protein